MPDKILTCRDCGANFTFTASQQQFYLSKGYAKEPERCPTCRVAYDFRLGTGTALAGPFRLRSPRPQLRERVRICSMSSISAYGPR
jgi:hypothetical protein